LDLRAKQEVDIKALNVSVTAAYYADVEKKEIKDMTYGQDTFYGCCMLYNGSRNDD
jgi:hypothetical protein